MSSRFFPECDRWPHPHSGNRFVAVLVADEVVGDGVIPPGRFVVDGNAEIGQVDQLIHDGHRLPIDGGNRVFQVTDILFGELDFGLVASFVTHRP